MLMHIESLVEGDAQIFDFSGDFSNCVVNAKEVGNFNVSLLFGKVDAIRLIIVDFDFMLLHDFNCRRLAME